MQLATRFDEAPVAYLLSALAAVVYIVATAALVRGGRGRRRTALVAITVELVGVLVVGTLSLADRAAFPDETVWSATAAATTSSRWCCRCWGCSCCAGRPASEVPAAEVPTAEVPPEVAAAVPPP